MRVSIPIFLLMVVGLAGCSKPVEGQLIQINSIRKLDDGWEFRLAPNTQGLELLGKGVRYSIDVGDPKNAANYDAKGCSIAANREPFPIGDGVNVSFHSSGNHKSILFDGKQTLTCDRQGQAECFQVYSTVRLQGGGSSSLFSRVDPELIDPLIVELCNTESPKIVTNQPKTGADL